MEEAPRSSRRKSVAPVAWWLTPAKNAQPVNKFEPPTGPRTAKLARDGSSTVKTEPRPGQGDRQEHATATANGKEGKSRTATKAEVDLEHAPLNSQPKSARKVQPRTPIPQLNEDGEREQTEQTEQAVPDAQGSRGHQAQPDRHAPVQRDTPGPSARAALKSGAGQTSKKQRSKAQCLEQDVAQAPQDLGQPQQQEDPAEGVQAARVQNKPTRARAPSSGRTSGATTAAATEPAGPAQSAQAGAEAGPAGARRPQRVTAQLAKQRLRGDTSAAPPDLFARPEEVRMRAASAVHQEEDLEAEAVEALFGMSQAHMAGDAGLPRQRKQKADTAAADKSRQPRRAAPKSSAVQAQSHHGSDDGAGPSLKPSMVTEADEPPPQAAKKRKRGSATSTHPIAELTAGKEGVHGVQDEDQPPVKKSKRTRITPVDDSDGDDKHAEQQQAPGAQQATVPSQHPPAAAGAQDVEMEPAHARAPHARQARKAAGRTKKGRRNTTKPANLPQQEGAPQLDHTAQPPARPHRLVLSDLAVLNMHQEQGEQNQVQEEEQQEQSPGEEQEEAEGRLQDVDHVPATPDEDAAAARDDSPPRQEPGDVKHASTGATEGLTGPQPAALQAAPSSRLHAAPFSGQVLPAPPSPAPARGVGASTDSPGSGLLVRRRLAGGTPSGSPAVRQASAQVKNVGMQHALQQQHQQEQPPQRFEVPLPIPVINTATVKHSSGGLTGTSLLPPQQLDPEQGQDMSYAGWDEGCQQGNMLGEEEAQQQGSSGNVPGLQEGSPDASVVQSYHFATAARGGLHTRRAPHASRDPLRPAGAQHDLLQEHDLQDAYLLDDLLLAGHEQHASPAANRPNPMSSLMQKARSPLLPARHVPGHSSDTVFNELHEGQQPGSARGRQQSQSQSQQAAQPPLSSLPAGWVPQDLGSQQVPQQPQLQLGRVNGLGMHPSASNGRLQEQRYSQQQPAGRGAGYNDTLLALRARKAVAGSQSSPLFLGDAFDPPVDADEQLGAGPSAGQGQQQQGYSAMVRSRHTGETPAQGKHEAPGGYQQRHTAGPSAYPDMHRTPLLGMGGQPRPAAHAPPGAQSNAGGWQGMPAPKQQQHNISQPVQNNQQPSGAQPRSIPSMPSLLASAQRLGDMGTLRPALVPALKPHIAQQSLARLGAQQQSDQGPRLLQAGQSLSAGNRAAGPSAQGGPVVSLGRLPMPSKPAGAARKTARRKDTALLDDDWEPEQVQALLMAYRTTEPTHPRFWQEVATHVPGRTAAECFQRIFDQHKTPEEKARIPKPARLAAARFASSQAQAGGSDEEGGAAGDLASLGAGGVAPPRKPTEAALLRWAREQHTRATLERLAASHGVEPGQELPPEVLGALQQKEQHDRYLASFLNQNGGWKRWQRVCKQGHNQRASTKAGDYGEGRHAGGKAAALASVISNALHEAQEAEADFDDDLDGRDCYWEPDMDAALQDGL